MKNTKEERYSIELRSLKMSLDINLYIIHDPVEEDCPHCGQKYLNIFDNKECVYEGNITHNLNRMAEACGIYMELWRPEEIGVIKAEQDEIETKKNTTNKDKDLYADIEALKEKYSYDKNKRRCLY